jgi:hypothetical protein
MKIKKRIIKFLVKYIKVQLEKEHFQKHICLEKENLTFAEDNLFTFNNADFIKDEKFKLAYKLGKNTDIGVLKDYDFRWRIHVLLWAAAYASKLNGDFVECGVNTGVFARAIINYIRFQELNKKYFLLDTFNGLDPRYSSDYEMQYDKMMGYKNQSDLYQHVQKIFSEFENVKIIQGSIPDTLSEVESEKICFLSIDMNCVYPEIEAINYFWDKIVPGGIIVLDDYGYPGHMNQKNAFDEFAKKKDIEILTLPTCQGLIIKNV